MSDSFENYKKILFGFREVDNIIIVRCFRTKLMLQNQAKKYLSIINNDNSSDKEVNNAYREFLDVFIKSTDFEQSSALQTLTSLFVSSDSKYLGALANSIGGLFERGYNPRSVTTELIEYFEKLLTASTVISQSFT